MLISRANWTELANSIAGASPVGLILAFFLAMASWSVNTFKWQRLLQALGERCPYFSLFGLNLTGLFYSLLLPGQVSGEVVKGVKLGRAGVPSEAVAATIAVDRLSGVSAICIWALAGLLFSPPNAIRGPMLSAALALLLISSVPLIGAKYGPGELLSGLATRSPSFIAMLLRTLLSWQRALSMLNRPKLAAETLFLSLFSQLLVAASNYAVAQGVGVEIPFVTILWIVSAVSLAHMAPISFAGLGVREGAYVLLLSQEGVSISLGLTLSLAVFSIILAQGILGGVIELVGGHKGLVKPASAP